MTTGRTALGLLTLLALACAGPEAPIEVTTRALTVGGCDCPSWEPGVSCGALSYADIPADDTYYITTYGGAGDGQDMWICGHQVTDNGSWAYLAGHERFGCGKVLIRNPQNGKTCVGQVADCGPNRCVEQAACKCSCQGHVPILDVSPFITQHLFGISSSGWSEEREVVAWQVDAGTAIGCGGDVPAGEGFFKGVVYRAPDTSDRVAGATVTLNTGQSATTDGVGYFEFELAAGTYTATASKAGFQAASSTRTVVAGADVWGSIGLTFACACDDDNPCTDDGCDAAGACLHTPNTATCDDGNACSTGDTCEGGSCQGIVISCDDGDPCTVDGCSAATGCVHTPKASAAPCDDGDVCTTDDTCVAGSCQGDAISCDDGEICTDDGCDPTTGCTHTPNTAPCDDGAPCTTGDTCTGGSCLGVAAACDDGDPCTDDACDPVTGACLTSFNEAPCDDGAPCTAGDACADGVCAGALAACDDGAPCTDDHCDPATGACSSSPREGSCDDGDPCTLGDACAAGVCLGAPMPCDDGEPCTDDACDPLSGACVFTPNAAPCDDGEPCTVDDACEGGVCGGAPDDGAACDDEDACTLEDACDGGACVGQPLEAAACDDGVACTLDSCDPAAGCTHLPSDARCDDGEACTEDLCLLDSGCAHAHQVGACDDGDACTVDDTCQAGQCIPTALVSCDDGDACTVDACVPLSGACVHAPLELSCDDGEPCTDDLCDPATGACAHPPLGGACDDGDPCTQNDTCAHGQCQPGAPRACADGNPCTDDGCDGATGQCVFTPGDGPCDDGDPCTEAACVGGACQVVATRPHCCAQDADCGPAGTCDPDTETCEIPACAPCDEDEDCGPGGRCLGMQGGAPGCAPPCGADLSCAEGYVCEIVADGARLCVPEDGGCGPVSEPTPEDVVEAADADVGTDGLPWPDAAGEEDLAAADDADDAGGQDATMDGAPAEGLLDGTRIEVADAARDGAPEEPAAGHTSGSSCALGAGRGAGGPCAALLWMLLGLLLLRRDGLGPRRARKER